MEKIPHGRYTNLLLQPTSHHRQYQTMITVKYIVLCFVAISLFIAAMLSLSACTHIKNSNSGKKQKYIAIYNGRLDGRYSLGVKISDHLDGGWRNLQMKSPFRGEYENDDSHLTKPSFVKVRSDLYYLYVQRGDFHDTGYRTNIVRFESKNGLDWESSGEMNISGYSPSVLFDDKEKVFHMWVARDGGMYYSKSEDGLLWTDGLLVMEDSLADELQWDRIVVPKYVMRDGQGFILFYQGVDADGWFQGGVARFQNPAGEYIRDINNPILKRDVYGSLKIYLAGDSRRIAYSEIGQNHSFENGQYVLVLGDNKEWITNQIIEISPSGKIVFANDVNIDGHIYVRSYQYSKVYPTHAVKDVGGWQILGTCFDQHRGITSSGIEFTCISKGPDFDSLEWIKLLPPPLGVPDGVSWDGTSIENPSVLKVMNSQRY